MAQIGTVRLETQNSGVVDVPVFEPGDSASGIYEFVRLETASGPGFIPVTDPADATYPYLRVQSQNNGIVAVTDTPGSDIPDVSMFDGATRQWFAGDTTAADGETLSTWSGQLSETDVAAVNSPTQTTIVGEPAIEYNSADSDRHENTAGEVFDNDNEFTIAVVCYFESNSRRQTVATRKDGVGDFSIANDNGTPTLFMEGISNATGSSTVGTDQYVTLSATYDGSNGVIYYNGSSDGSTSGSSSFSDADPLYLAYRALTGNYGDVHVQEVVVSSVAESGTNISSFSNDRLS